MILTVSIIYVWVPLDKYFSFYKKKKYSYFVLFLKKNSFLISRDHLKNVHCGYPAENDKICDKNTCML